ncbi:MAG: D-xylose transport system substrate-binding protein [Actinomycetota bacterium]|nr:D-xylose transport system substrate-binding protein [Actinomycetota bacterium]
MVRNGPRILVAACLATAVVPLSGCGDDSDESSSSERTGRVAFFLPHPKADRYEAIDLPYFHERLAELCPGCTVDYRNANNDQDAQNKQFAEALSQGAQVMVLDPVSSADSAALVAQAQQKGVPVISYDRTILKAPFDYLVSFDHVEVGRQQAQALLTAMGTSASRGKVLWINGPPTDSNAIFMKQGASEILDGKVSVAAEFTMPGPKWDKDAVQAWVDKTLPTLDVTSIVGVYAVDDASAGVVASALAARGVKKMPPITGQNADTAGLQRILSGTQYMTAYKPVQQEARLAAETAFALLTGKKPEATSTLNNGSGARPAMFVKTEAVTGDRIKDTVLKDGFLTENALCAAAFADACRKAGITG